MDEAERLFQEGLILLRDANDMAGARRALLASLKLNPRNDMAWVWLSRVVTDADKRRECLRRALKLNPENDQARSLLSALDKMRTQEWQAVAEQTVGARSLLRSTGRYPAVSADGEPEAAQSVRKLPPSREIERYLKRANAFVEDGDPEKAIEEWVAVLKLEVDHEEAMRQAVRYLSRMKYIDDARELVMRAMHAGRRTPRFT